MKENTKIKIKHKENEYILEYDRNTVKLIEQQGFSMGKVQEQPMSMIPLLFEGAFYKNHKFLKKQTVDEIFESIPNKNSMLNPLITMVNECYSSLFEDTEVENAEGNASWEIV